LQQFTVGGIAVLAIAIANEAFLGFLTCVWWIGLETVLDVLSDFET
jgi:hypothetical protein